MDKETILRNNLNNLEEQHSRLHAKLERPTKNPYCCKQPDGSLKLVFGVLVGSRNELQKLRDLKTEWDLKYNELLSIL